MSTTSIAAALSSVSVERIRQHIARLEGIRHPVVAASALAEAETYIFDSLSALGYEMVRHEFTEDGYPYRNIIATWPGADLAGERVVVLAHYDTTPVTPGADDNASGVAAMLELATVLRAAVFCRSLTFAAVNLEERKDQSDARSPFCRGSRALAGHARENGLQIAGVIVLETIAYAGVAVPQSGPTGLPVALPPVGDFIAIVANQASAGMVQHFAAGLRRYGIDLPYVPLVVPGNGEVLPDTRRSDHAAFWDRGYQAVMLTDTANFRNPHYHQPSDTLDTLNLSFCARVCQAAGAMVAEMAG
jgi:Zn-dependent M28 family amino/carboxypeptidase